MRQDRIKWVQCARGLTITLVVLGHMLYGIDEAIGIDPQVFLLSTTPLAMFRMPLFFFVAGIFAYRSIARPTETFLNRTLLHLVWIYLVWSVVHWAIKAPLGSLGNEGMDPMAIARILYRPIDVLWFIYVLALFFLVTRLLRNVPAFVVLTFAATMAAGFYETDPKWLQRAANTYVYFVMGYYGSELVLEKSRMLRPVHALLLVPAFAATALWLVASGHWKDPTLWFAGSLFGILAMCSFCIAVSETRLGDLMRFVGDNSLPIFVAHTIVGPTTRVLLHKGGVTSDPAVLVPVCTVVATGAPIVMALLADRLGMSWLFRRPAWFSVRLGGAQGEAAGRDGASPPPAAGVPAGGAGAGGPR